MPVTVKAVVRPWRSTIDGGLILSFEVPLSEKKAADEITDFFGKGVVHLVVMGEHEVQHVPQSDAPDEREG